MSEIKGQLLGIILVIAVFGVVLAAMSAAFLSSSQAIQSRVEDAASMTAPEADENDHNGRVLNEKGYSLHY